MVDRLVARLIDEKCQALFDAEQHRVVVMTNVGVVELNEFEIDEVFRLKIDRFSRREEMSPIILEPYAIAIRLRSGRVVWSIGKMFYLPARRRPFG